MNDQDRLWPADNVERRLVADLIPYARNARTHTDEQVAQLAAAITEWGWTNSILLDEHDGIIAGHGRVLAARKLGIMQVPCIVARGWSNAQKRAYVLADNKLALNSGWDLDLLGSELKGLQEDGFEVGLVGFSDEELSELTMDPTEGLTDPDAAPPPGGTHRLRRGRHLVARATSCGVRKLDRSVGGGQGTGGRPPASHGHRSALRRELRPDLAAAGWGGFGGRSDGKGA